MVAEKPRSVVIDGLIYVPATEAVAGLDTFMQALFEGYMGEGRRWTDGRFPQMMSVIVTDDDDGDGETFERLAARMSAIAVRDTANGEQDD